MTDDDVTSVPHGWKYDRIASAGKVQAGRQRINDAPGTPRAYLRVANVFDGRISSVDLNWMSFTDEEFERFRLVPGDVLLNEGQSLELVGRTAMYRGDPSECAFQNSLIRFRAHSSTDASFAEHLFRHLQRSGVFASVATKTTSIAHLGVSRFADLKALLPPLPEQRKISAVLSSVDEAIEATQAVIDQLGVVKKAMMAELLTRGLPGRHTKFKPLGEWRLGRIEQGLDELPDSWGLIPLTSVARLESGHTPSRRHPEYWDGDIPWISLHDSKNLESAEILGTAQTVSMAGVDNSSARILPKGTVVFSRTATVGKCTIMGREMCTSQDFANYVCGERLHNRYLMQVLRHMQPEWERLMAGSTHQTIYMPVFRDLQILLPPLDEQVEIADRIAAADTRIVAERAQLPALSAVKSALMSVLLTGEVRVKPDEAAP